MMPLKQVQLCCENLPEISELDECLLKCATAAIKDLVKETTALSPMASSREGLNSYFHFFN